MGMIFHPARPPGGTARGVVPLHLGMIFHSMNRFVVRDAWCSSPSFGDDLSPRAPLHRHLQRCSSPSFGDDLSLATESIQLSTTGVVPLHLGMIFHSTARRCMCRAGVVPLHLGMIFHSLHEEGRTDAGVVPLHLGMIFHRTQSVPKGVAGVVPLHLGMIFHQPAEGNVLLVRCSSPSFGDDLSPKRGELEDVHRV